MTDASATMADDIVRSVADHLGATLDPATRSTIAAEIAPSILVDPTTGRPVAVDANGNPVVCVRNGQAEDAGPEGLVDLVREALQRHRAATAPAAAASTAPATSALSSNFEGLTQKMLQRRAQETGDLRRQAEAAAATHGNPWLPGRENLTLRMALARHAPEVAERLKREAGITP